LSYCNFFYKGAFLQHNFKPQNMTDRNNSITGVRAFLWMKANSHFRKSIIISKLLSVLFLVPALAFTQTSYTVSNAPGSVANFKTLQGAHDSVAAGSILYVLPSSYSYGNIVFTKKLTIYGTGFFIGQNLEPNTQASPGAALINSLTFRPGSDNSYIEGLQLSYQADEQGNRINLDTVSNITISRCLLVSPTYGAYGGSHSFFGIAGANNCIIKQCYIQNTNGYTIPPVITYFGDHPNFSGLKFVNNIFDWIIIGYFRIGPYGNEGLTGGSTDATFTNNTFLITTKDATFGNLNFINNVFVDVTPSNANSNTYKPQMASAFNNVTNAGFLFSPLGTNQQGANTDSMFVGSQAGFHSIDQKWMLRAGDAANTFGQGGIAVGAFGGNNPYKLSGIPSIPYIYSMNVPSQATAPGTISVHIKAKPTN
jgi:hypothetical protein